MQWFYWKDWSPYVTLGVRVVVCICVRPAAGLAVMLMAFNTEVSFWSQTF